MGFARQEYWSGFPIPSPGDLLNPGIELKSPALQADSLPSEPSVEINGKTVHIHGWKTILLKCPYYSMPSIDSMQSISKSQRHFSQKWEKKFLKFTWNHIHKNVNGQSNLEKEKSWTHALILDFRIHCKATVIQTAEYWHKNRHADQRDSTEHRNKAMHLWPKGFHQTFQGHTTGKGVPSMNGLVYPSVEEGS